MNSARAPETERDAHGKDVPVLISVQNNTYFVELQRVAALLQRSKRYRPILIFPWPYQTRARDISRCLQDGLTCLDEQGTQIQGRCVATGAIEGNNPTDLVETGSKGRRLAVICNRGLKKLAALVWRLRRTAHRVCKAVDAVALGEYVKYLRFHSDRYQFALRLLEQTRAGLMVLAGDMVGYDSADFIRAAKARNVPVVLTPSTMSNGIEQAEVYYHDPAYHLRSLPNILASWLFPRWVRKHRGKRLLRRPAGDVFAMEKLGIAPPVPWTFNSGFADGICVESDAMMKYYLEGGLPPSQLHATGSLANDVLADGMSHAPARRIQLLRQLGLPADRPIILVALPPDFLYVNGGRPECDFTTYAGLVDFWMGLLRNVKNHNVILTLHPSVAWESALHLETETIKIANAPTASLIPLCDIFFASVSSTIRWAIACGKPVLNYDVYRYRYTDYVDVPGVVIVEDKDEIADVLLRLTSDSALLDEVTKKQRAWARHWGLLDGEVGTRMLALFDQLVKATFRIAA